MKQFSSVLLAILLFGLPAVAQGQAKDKSAEANKSLLWRISGKNLKAPSYLFGTMHTLCREDYFWTDKMQQSLDKCQGVCFEMNLNDPDLAAKAMAGFMKLIMTSLKGMIPEEMQGQMEKYMSDSMLKDPSMLSGISPGKLTGLSDLTAVPCDSTTSYEENIMEKALKNKKTVAGLEDIDEGIELLGKLFGSGSMDSLMSKLLNGSTSEADKVAEKLEYKQMMALYKNQDVPALYKYIAESKDSTLNTDVFLDQRNRKWIPRMTTQMEAKPVFFGVGAGHLWGNNGVINLLKQAGYKVEPVK